MSKTLDWKWIAIGIAIMFGLSFVAGMIMTALWRGDLPATAEEAQTMTVSQGQVILALILNFLAFAIGGFIVGMRSAGRTILEPGISAAIAVLILLVITGSFSVSNLLVSALIPFVAGLIGGWLGERQQGTTA